MKTVLFVCVKNAGRSQMAEAFFNRAAAGKARSISAGTRPGDAVHQEVIEVMKEIGIDVSGNRPRLLTFDLVEQADRMITMGCGADTEGVCPAVFIETEDWELDDPAGRLLAEVRRVRDEIKKRVDDLVIELGITGKGTTV
jgi:arsenate reductase (thioredoxin)